MDINCYKALFEQSSAMLLLMDKDFTVMAASDSYLKVTKTIREEITGKNIFDIFPDNPNDITAARKMRASFNRVIKNKKEDTPAILKYNIPKPQSEGGGFEVKYWKTVVSPMFDANHKLKYIIQRSEDITENEALTIQNREDKKALNIIEESNKRYHTILMQSPFAFSIMKGKDMLVTHANNKIKEIWGKGNEVEGKTLLQVLPELIDQPFPAMLDSVYTTGKPVYANEILARLNHHGKIEERYFNIIYQPHLEADETISGVITIAHEVTNQVLARKKIEVGEHRYLELVNSSPSLISICKGENMIIEIANDAMLASWGKGNIIGKSLFEAIPESVEQGFDKLLLGVYKTGVAVQAHESPVTLLRNGSKELVYYNFVYQAQHNINGEIEGVAIIANEVTQQALLNKKIRESEAFNRAVLESSPDCIKMLDAEGRVQFMNSNGICLLEIDDFKKVQNTHWWNMWQPQNRQTIKDAVAKAKSGEKTQFQLFSPTVKGTPKWWDIIVLPVEDDGTDKNLHWILSVSRDITEQKKVEEEIKENETRFRSIANASTATLWMSDENFQITYVNKTWIDWTGQPFEKHLGEGWLENILPEDQQPTREQVEKDFTARRNFKMDFRMKRADGKMRWCVSEGAPRYLSNGQFAGYAGTCVDITERKQNELKEKLILTRFQNLVLQAPVAICVLRGKDYVIEIINKGMFEMWGRTFEETINKPAFDVLPELKDQGFKELLDNVYNTGKRFVAEELPIQLRRNGKLESAFVKFVYEPLREADGTISGVMALAHEITEQVLARKKIEESELHFRQLADLMPSKISNAGIDGKIFYFNKSWLDFLGLDFEEVKDFGYHKIMHPDDLEEFQKRFLHATETGDNLEMEMRFKNKEGEFKWHLNIASPVKDENGNIKMWVGSTIEIQKIKEEERRKGDFIKMVSHELKTPVTSIKGYVQLLLMMLDDVQEKPDPLQLKISLVRIDRQVAKLTRLIIEMLDLTRIEESKLAMQKKLFNLNDMVTETVVDFSQGNLKHTITVYHDYVCNITGDKDRIEQVLINFIANAIKYSPNNGNIEIRVKASKNNQVAVSVKDNGIGIDAKDHQKIFERFYRVSGKSEQYYPGFGIGLFIANAIIESQDGFITIDSEKGKGSVFTFTLPCT